MDLFVDQGSSAPFQGNKPLDMQVRLVLKLRDGAYCAAPRLMVDSVLHDFSAGPHVMPLRRITLDADDDAALTVSVALEASA